MRIRGLSRRAAITLLVAGIGLLAALPLWQAGFLNKRIIGETPYLLMRVQQLYLELRAGVFPVRWMPDGAYGFGYPFFNFYAALPFYVAAGLRLVGLGTILSIKVTQTFSFIVGALGVYVWLRPHLRSTAAAITAAALFTFAPMHLINIYTRGDSLSEFWAMSMYPLVLWAVDRVITRPRPPTIALLAAMYGVLLLSHNISALIFTPFVGLYALWMLIPRWRTRRVAMTTGVAFVGAVVLGLALSAWFVVPALTERSTVGMAHLLEGFFDYHNSFLDNALVQNTLAIDYSAYPYRFGLWQAITTVMGIGAAIIILMRRNRHSRLASWSLFALLISTIMTLSTSTWLYDHVPLLAYIQFPWRWLSIVALMSAAVGAYAVDVWPLGKLRVRREVVALPIVVITAIVAFVSLNLNFFPLTEGEITSSRLNEGEYFSGDIGTTVRADYLPAAVHPRPVSGPAILGLYPLKVIDGSASGNMTDRQVNEETWRVSVTDEQATVAVPIFFWPGWVAQLENGSVLPTSAADGSGWIEVTVPKGDHVLTLSLRETPARWFVDAISALALLVVLTLVLRASIRWIRANRNAVLVGLVSIVVLVALIRIWPPAVPADGPQASQFETVSYRHAFPGGIVFHNGARLIDYSYPSEITAGSTLMIKMNWDDARPQVTAHVELIPAPVNFWKYDSALVTGTGTDVVTLTPPLQSTPGLYFVHLDVDHDIYDLAPVRVIAATQPELTTQTVDFGGVLRLLDVNAQPIDNGRLNIFLRWQTLKPVTKSYGLNVVVSNPAGIQIAKHDAMLGVYGTVPPEFWPTTFTDWFTLSGLDGLPPGDGYRFVITLFDDDRAIGSAELRDISIATSPATTKAIEAQSGCVSQSRNIEQGDWLVLACSWIGPYTANEQVQWQLHDQAGHEWEIDTPLAPGARLDWWQPNIVYKALIPLSIPIDLAPGKYAVTWSRAGNVPNQVGTVEIKPTTRLMSPPPITNPTTITFGDLLQLQGYKLHPADGKLSIRLVWQAKAAIDVDYTYFVHVQRTDSSTPDAQIDTMPHDNQYPTSRWLPDEYVVDETQINVAGLQSGTYDVWLGWYDPHTGRRLSVPNSDDNRFHLASVQIP